MLVGHRRSSTGRGDGGGGGGGGHEQNTVLAFRLVWHSHCALIAGARVEALYLICFCKTHHPIKTNAAHESPRGRTGGHECPVYIMIQLGHSAAITTRLPPAGRRDVRAAQIAV